MYCYKGMLGLGKGDGGGGKVRGGEYSSHRNHLSKGNFLQPIISTTRQCSLVTGWNSPH